MIIWITGEQGAGKTTLSREFKHLIPHAVMLDGDDMRASITIGLGFSEEDRKENNRRIARLAKLLEIQGLTVIVSTICPEYCRQEVFNICKPRWIHL